jgi:lipoate-protein ligase A
MVSDTFDPWFNLATEDWIFQEMNPDTNILFLWRNSETVVIGRFQNPWTECNTQKMDDDSIKLARRQSGGGAVFHDLGNTNFTFLNSKENYDKEVNNKIITNAVNSFNLNSYASGRNDLLVDVDNEAKKFSGSAFKEKKDRSFHHGTLLIDADLSRLANYLNPDKKKLESKGIKSVRARVANLATINKEITHESLCEKIIAEFFKHYGSKCEIEILDNESLKKEPKLLKYYDQLKDWKWRFGETPKFNHQMETRFEWGGMEVHIDSHKGIITDSKIYSDSLHPEMIESITSNLIGKSYDKKGIDEAMLIVNTDLPMIKDYLTEFATWLSKEIS